jgi:hypothetical protein
VIESEISTDRTFTLEKLQRFGFRRFVIANGVTVDTDIPTPDEMESAYESAPRVAGEIVQMRAIECSLGLFAHTGVRGFETFLKPNAAGRSYLVAPIFGQHNRARRIIDLFFFAGPGIDGKWCGPRGQADYWALATGRGAIVNGGELSKAWTPESPLQVHTSPFVWASSGCEGVIVIKEKAKCLLSQAAYVRCQTCEEAEALDLEYFSELPGRGDAVQGPQDWDSIAAFIEKKAHHAAWLADAPAREAAERAARLARRKIFVEPSAESVN